MTSATPTASDVLFAHVACRAEDELDLATAALLIGEVERPGLDVSSYVAQLDRWGAAGRRAAGDSAPGSIARLEALRDLLFDELGFRGNQDDYYDPRNSFLDQVIDRRTGIPISLSVVAIEVARRMEIDAQGIGFPGHFLILIRADGGEVVLDAFNRGETLDFDDVQKRLEATSPGTVLTPSHLPLFDKRQILVRMLTNLRAIYARAGDAERKAAIAARLELLAEPRERAPVSSA